MQSITNAKLLSSFVWLVLLLVLLYRCQCISVSIHTNMWVKEFKNWPGKICGRQPLKYLTCICLGRPYHFIFFKGCLPQILLGPSLNTLSHVLFICRITNYYGREFAQLWNIFSLLNCIVIILSDHRILRFNDLQ